MNSMQQHNLSQHGHAYRATHVKTQGIVKGTLTVLPDLPSHLQQGLFRTPGKSYDVAARYSNEPVWLAPDQDPGPRGLAIRVFGAEGEREGDPDATTQDFFFNNAPSIELTDAATCLDVMRMRERYFDSPVKLGAATRLRTDALKQVAPFQLPSKDLLGMSFYSQSAFRFGEWYGHFGVFPVGEEMRGREKGVGSGDGKDALSRWLREYFEGKGAKYEIRVSLRNCHVVLMMIRGTSELELMGDRSSLGRRQSTTLPRTAQSSGMKPQPHIKRLRQWNFRRRTRWHRSAGCFGKIACG